MAKKVKKPHIDKFYRDVTFSTAVAIGEVLQVIEDLRQAYPTQASKVKVVDVHLTETYGHNNQRIIIKYIYIDKPQKGVQEIDLNDLSLQEIIDRYL